MNHDEKFRQRWEFRRRDDGGDSSDDAKSNSSEEPIHKKPKLITNLILSENDEASNTPRYQHLDSDNDVQLQTFGAAKRKTKLCKRKIVVKDKSKQCSFKERKGRKRNNEEKYVGMLEELKIFANSLMLELKVARENMFGQMIEETRSLVDYRPVLGPRMQKVRCLQKNKVHRQNGIELSMVERNVKSNIVSDVSKSSKADEADIRHDQVLEVSTINELQQHERVGISAKPRIFLSNDADHQVVSSPYLTLPIVVPKPQLQSSRNITPSDDRIPAGVPGNSSSSDMEIGKLMDGKDSHHGIQAFQPELFGIFSHMNCKSASFLGQNFSGTTSASTRFLIPPHQMIDNGSDLSSLTYSENAFQDSSRVGLRTNARVTGGSPALSEGIFTNMQSSSNVHHKTDGEFALLRSYGAKDGQFYPRMRNKR